MTSLLTTSGFRLAIVSVVGDVEVVGAVARPGGQRFELELAEGRRMPESLSEIAEGENFEAAVANFVVVVVGQTGGCADLR